MYIMGKILVTTGTIILIAGIILLIFSKLPLLIRLPGDLSITISNVRFYAPLVSCLLFSIVLTIIINIMIRLFH